jgi:hypothetical protein
MIWKVAVCDGRTAEENAQLSLELSASDPTFRELVIIWKSSCGSIMGDDELDASMKWRDEFVMIMLRWIANEPNKTLKTKCFRNVYGEFKNMNNKNPRMFMTKWRMFA